MKSRLSRGLLQLGRNLSILAAGELVTRVLTAAAFIYLARVLQPEGFGLVEFAMAIMMFFFLWVDQGLGTYGAREAAKAPDDMQSLVRRILSAQVTLSVTGFMLLLVLTLSLSKERDMTFLLLGFGLSTMAAPFFLRWVFQGRDQMVWVAVPQALRYTVFFLVVLLLVKSDENVALVPIAEILGVTCAAAVCVLVFRRGGGRIELDLRRPVDRSLFAQTLPIGGSEFIWVARMYLPTVVIGLLASREDVGLFSASHRIMMVFQSMLSVYFINLFPTLSREAIAGGAGFSRLVHNSLRLAVWSCAALALIIAFTGPKLILFLFGPQYTSREGITILLVLIWLLPVFALRGHGRDSMVALMRQREELFCSVAGVVLLGLLIIPMTNTLGAIGAVYSMVASELIATVMIWWRLTSNQPLLRPVGCLFGWSLKSK